jgi:hypothetical protein
MHRMTVRGLMIRIAVLSVFLAGVAWLARAVHWAREAALRSDCVNQLKGLTLALHNYHVTYGSFPPAYVEGSDGRRMHSWRVLILPFLPGAKTSLYQRYQWEEPWDGPNNRMLADEIPQYLKCPSRPDTDHDPYTSYVVVTGPATAFPARGSSASMM